MQPYSLLPEIPIKQLSVGFYKSNKYSWKITSFHLSVSAISHSTYLQGPPIANCKPIMADNESINSVAVVFLQPPTAGALYLSTDHIAIDCRGWCDTSHQGFVEIGTQPSGTKALGFKNNILRNPQCVTSSYQLCQSIQSALWPDHYWICWDVRQSLDTIP